MSTAARAALRPGITGTEPLRRDRRERLEELPAGDGRRLPDHLKAQVRRELDRLELLLQQIKAVAARDALLATEPAVTPGSAAMLGRPQGHRTRVRGHPLDGGALPALRQPAPGRGLCSLAPPPWQSGSGDRAQGVAKSGHPRLRPTPIQLAWLWIRQESMSVKKLPGFFDSDLLQLFAFERFLFDRVMARDQEAR